MKTRTFRSVAGGGSSLLVVFMMVFLVSLGAFAMISSESSLKLARKGASWIRGGYMLEAGGEAFMHMVSQNLAKSPPLTHDEDREWLNTLTTRIEDCLEKQMNATAPKLPFGVVLSQASVESNHDASITITARLLKEHESTGRYLLIKAKYTAHADESAPFSYHILKWQQYQEPFQYETEPGRW